MAEEQSTNQNHVKNQIFLWITGQFHFRNWAISRIGANSKAYATTAGLCRECIIEKA
jgi:hypothetical protein